MVRFYRLCNNVLDFLARVRLLYLKLESRGYDGKILSKYFLKFCSRYPADIKYGVPDGESLWMMSTNYKAIKSCCVYDYDAIEKMTRPCKVMLQDINSTQKATFTQTLKPCIVRLDGIQ